MADPHALAALHSHSHSRILQSGSTDVPLRHAPEYTLRSRLHLPWEECSLPAAALEMTDDILTPRNLVAEFGFLATPRSRLQRQWTACAIVRDGLESGNRSHVSVSGFSSLASAITCS